MAMIYDLTEYLSEEKPKIKIKDEEYEVNNGLSTAMDLNALSKKRESMDGLEFVCKALSITLGAKHAKQLIERGYPLDFYKKVFETISNILSEGDESPK